MTEQRIIYVGKKPVHTYVRAVWMVMLDGQREILLTARGGAIKTAVDVAEICRRRHGIIAARLPEDTRITAIESDTETVPRENGEGRVSVLRISIEGQGEVQRPPEGEPGPSSAVAASAEEEN